MRQLHYIDRKDRRNCHICGEPIYDGVQVGATDRKEMQAGALLTANADECIFLVCVACIDTLQKFGLKKRRKPWDIVEYADKVRAMERLAASIMKYTHPLMKHTQDEN